VVKVQQHKQLGRHEDEELDLGRGKRISKRISIVTATIRENTSGQLKHKVGETKILF
jgi:hypothetical protein